MARGSGNTFVAVRLCIGRPFVAQTLPRQYLASSFDRIAVTRVVESGLVKSIDSWFSPFSEGIPGGHDVNSPRWTCVFVTDFLGRRMQFVLLHCTMLGSKSAKHIEFLDRVG